MKNFNNQLETYENLQEYRRSLRQEEEDELEPEDTEELMSEAEYLEDR